MVATRAPGGGQGSAGQRWRALGYRLRCALYRSPLYRFSLPSGGAAGAPAALGGDTWPGDAVQGSAIAQGTLTFAGQGILNPAPLWSPPAAHEAWLAALHGFGWLRDLKAMDSEAGRAVARGLIERWIADNPRWHPLTWRPDVLGRRLAAWLGHCHAIGADDVLTAALVSSARRQAAHLSRTLPGPLAGGRLVAGIKGLIYAGLALPGGEAWLRRGLQLLERELAAQLLSDGGQIERSPSVHLGLLCDLVDLRTALTAAGRPVSEALTAAIAGLAPMLRLYRHGDGGLALFNDSGEDEAWRIDAVLVRADARDPTPTEAPATGFHRLAARRTVVIVDAGAPPPPGYDSHAHAGTLAFEMSVGQDRLIVNCGAHPSDPDWRTVQRHTAAHSTLVLADTSSAVLRAEGGVALGPRRVTWQRHEAEANAWLDLSHDGYRKPFGVEHRRRLYLAASGDEFRGEDRAIGRGGNRADVRFHLHPDVQVSLTQNRQGAILRLPGGGGWRMRAVGGRVAVEDSIYLGRGQVRRGYQIVVTLDGPEDGDTVKWVFAREKRG